MATDVDVQYFSHLNGLTLGNNWGDLIRLLDKALVTGIDFTQITAASIDEQGDVHITLYSAHNAMLFQVVELSGFAPASLNQKYRIKGVPSTTKLILKPPAAITETSVASVGSGKLASLGYEIIFRDAHDVKRVYRAKNPTAQHPFIRIDESLISKDGTTGVYTSTYAKYAIVGLLEHMEHIDDYENPDVLQLPFDPADPAKNWKIIGTGTSVIKGWARWYYAAGALLNSSRSDSDAPQNGGRQFTLAGGKNSFFINRAVDVASDSSKSLMGCGLLQAQLDMNSKNWFLAAYLNTIAAGGTHNLHSLGVGGSPVFKGGAASRIIMPKISELTPLNTHTTALSVIPDLYSGYSGIYNGLPFSGLQIPQVDNDNCLRGVLENLIYLGNDFTNKKITTPYLSGGSMYIIDSTLVLDRNGAMAYYLGELE